MYPALLVLRPCLARQMLDYRTDLTRCGLSSGLRPRLSGAMFPWEGDDRGEEATPTLPSPVRLNIILQPISPSPAGTITRDADRVAAPRGASADARGCTFQRSRYGECRRQLLIRQCDRSQRIRRRRHGQCLYQRRAPPGTGVRFGCGGALRRASHPQWSVVAGPSHPALRRRNDARACRLRRRDDREQADANLLGYPLGIVTDAKLSCAI